LRDKNTGNFCIIVLLKITETARGGGGLGELWENLTENIPIKFFQFAYQTLVSHRLPIFNNVLTVQVKYSEMFYMPREQNLLVKEISTSSVQLNAARKSVFPVS
jgi:hypothetical protein